MTTTAAADRISATIDYAAQEQISTVTIDADTDSLIALCRLADGHRGVDGEIHAWGADWYIIARDGETLRMSKENRREK